MFEFNDIDKNKFVHNIFLKKSDISKKMSIINRVETCPTLIRTFFQKDAHHDISDYTKEFPSPEVYVYTWIDATLRELSYTIIRSAKLTDVQELSFKMVEPNMKEGGWTMRDLGVVDLTDLEKVETVTLEGYDFRPGFMLDVAYKVIE